MNANDIPAIDRIEEEALSAILAVMRTGRRIIVAYSGGKDSTTVLLLTLKAARMLRQEGLVLPGILVTHGDTGVENPAVVALVARELRKARAYGEKHGFQVQTEIARPLLNDSWAVSIIGGRKLPTFANSGSRDCTINFKVRPMTRLRNRLLKGERTTIDARKPITLTGTRYEESDGRAARMAERGETAHAPWQKDGEWFLSPIAFWDMGDVWEYIGSFRNGTRIGFTDGRDIFDMYASATESTCAVVGDLASEETKKKRACGARFGCAVCTAVGRDKSLEAMLNDPENAWLRPINRVQRFLVDTQYDWSRRTWLNRSLDEAGYLAITPDTYSPAMLADLLRYCLTVDALEIEAAWEAGVRPRFQLVNYEQLLAIDALWSLNGIQKRPFEALYIWKQVHEEGRRFFPPEMESPVPATPKPAARYLKVGKSWDGDEERMFTGLRDVLLEEFGDEGCLGTRELRDGRTVLDMYTSPTLSFDPEAMELFMQFEADYVLENYHASSYSPCTQAFFHYGTLGMLSTSEGHIQKAVDRIMRRTSWKLREHLTGDIDVEALLARTVSKAERDAELRAVTGKVDADEAVEGDEGPVFAEAGSAEMVEPSTTPQAAPRVYVQASFEFETA